MGDKKHKHKSKDKKKDRDKDRDRERERKRDRDDNRECDYERHRKSKQSRRHRSRSRSRSRSKRRSKSRSLENTRVRSRSPNRAQAHSSTSGHKSKHSHDERYNPPSERDRDSSSPEPTQRHNDVDEHTTNLVNFTFLDYKSQLSKILLGYRPKDRLIDDINDFWLFLQKYETTLRNSGQSILPEPIIDPSTIDPNTFHRQFCVRLKFAIPFENLYGRLSSYDQSKLSELKIRQFLDIVLQYLDFRQKERFDKIRKLRQMQAELPVAKYKDEIIAAVKQEQVVLVSIDTIIIFCLFIFYNYRFILICRWPETLDAANQRKFRNTFDKLAMKAFAAPNPDESLVFRYRNELHMRCFVN